MPVASTVVLASLFTGEVSELERVKILKKHFSPPIGVELRLLNDSLHLDANINEVAKLKGVVTVNPPKNVCFLITKSPEVPDINVCKKTEISFYLNDITESGHIKWDVKTGANDIGTIVSWPTPYRRGSYVDLKMPWPGDSKDFFLADCETKETDLEGRKIYISLLTGQKWVIRLPQKEQMAFQPRQVLYKDVSEVKKPKGGVIMFEQNPQILAKLLRLEDYDKYDDGEWVPTWKMPAIDSYEMSSSGFMPFGSQTPNAKSKCRYRYYGTIPDRDSGLFECHETPDYKWIYFPITCLKNLKR